MIFRKSAKKVPASLKWDEIKGTLLEDQCTFFIISSSFLLECELFQTKVVEKIKTHILWSVTCFRKSCRLWGNFGKYCRAVQDTWQYGACALHAGYLRLQIHTHSSCVTLIAFPQHQWLNEGASMLHYTYVDCLVLVSFRILIIFWNKCYKYDIFFNYFGICDIYLMHHCQ
jgi:hypothetical protein